MAKVLQDAGHRLKGFEGLVHSTVPTGSGLSSSAALEVATIILFQQIGGFGLDPVEAALLGQIAENSFVGVNCGILDQYSSMLGRPGSALLLDCRHLTSQAVSLPERTTVMICDTRAERHLAGTEYAERRAQCEAGVADLRTRYPDIMALRDLSLTQFEAEATQLTPLGAQRCRFIIEENQRVLDLAAALPAGDEDVLHILFS